MGGRLALGVTPNFARCHPIFCEVSPQILRGVTPNFARCHLKFCEVSPPKMRGVTPKNARRHPTPARSHPENGEMAPHQFFKNNSFPEAN